MTVRFGSFYVGMYFPTFFKFLALSQIESILSTVNQKVLLIINGGNFMYVLFWTVLSIWDTDS